MVLHQISSLELCFLGVHGPPRTLVTFSCVSTAPAGTAYPEDLYCIFRNTAHSRIMSGRMVLPPGSHGRHVHPTPVRGPSPIPSANAGTLVLKYRCQRNAMFALIFGSAATDGIIKITPLSSTNPEGARRRLRAVMSCQSWHNKHVHSSTTSICCTLQNAPLRML